MDDRVTGYARAILDLATAEGELERVETEFLAIGQAFDGSVVPLTAGFCILGFLAIGAVLFTERGRLFRGAYAQQRK